MLGAVIHGYRIDRALSADKGGFGDVYFATHVESGAEAVVKVLKPEMSAHRDIVTRFFNEARAAASVHHPGIVQIHNVGYHGDRAYLLMERLRGADLETRLQAGPLPVDRAIVFLRQAAGAVGAAHDRGIVHRDLKPANLFVVADPPPRAVAPWVPPAIEQLILRLLEKQPERRLPSCAALIAALDEVAAAAGIVVTNAPRMPSGQVATVPKDMQLQFATTSPEPRPPFAAPPHAPARGFAAEASPYAIPNPANAVSSTKRARGFRRLLWIVGVQGAAVGTVVAILVPLGGGSSAPRAAGSAVAAPGDAAIGAPAADAAIVAVATPDAAVPDAAALDAADVVVADAGVSGGARSQDAPSKDPCGTTHIEELVTDARNQFSAGRAKAALAQLNRALACKPDVRLYRLAAMYACVARDLARAKLYIEEVAPMHRPAIEQRCQQEGLPLREASPSATSERQPSQAEIAARVNEEGRQLMFQDKPEAAVRQFQEAVARVPEAKYFINLCTALLQAGRLGDAITACKGGAPESYSGAASEGRQAPRPDQAGGPAAEHRAAVICGETARTRCQAASTDIRKSRCVRPRSIGSYSIHKASTWAPPTGRKRVHRAYVVEPKDGP